MEMMKKVILSIVALTMMFVLLTACSKSNEQEEEPKIPVNKPKENEQPQEVEEEKFMAPFTGMMLEEESTMRPVLATINNDPKARPQSGLSEADIIYELIAEGNMTRYLALFQSSLPDEIGPIRSSRDMFIHTAKGLDAFYVAHGYSPDALALLQAGVVDHVNGMQHDGTLFKRSPERRAPHNSYISGENIKLAEEQVNASTVIQKMPALSFHDSVEDVKIEEEASSITVQNGSHPQFTSVYTYDADAGVYQQFVNDVETIDKANGQSVELSNILVIEAEHHTIDAEGRQSIDLESGGKALLFQAGAVKEMAWRNANGIFMPVDNGVPAKLVPGKTWIHIIRTDPGIEMNASYTP